MSRCRITVQVYSVLKDKVCFNPLVVVLPDESIQALVQKTLLLYLKKAKEPTDLPQIVSLQTINSGRAAAIADENDLVEHALGFEGELTIVVSDARDLMFELFTPTFKELSTPRLSASPGPRAIDSPLQRIHVKRTSSRAPLSIQNHTPSNPAPVADTVPFSQRSKYFLNEHIPPSQNGPNGSTDDSHANGFVTISRKRSQTPGSSDHDAKRVKVNKQALSSPSESVSSAASAVTAFSTAQLGQVNQRLEAQSEEDLYPDAEQYPHAIPEELLPRNLPIRRVTTSSVESDSDAESERDHVENGILAQEPGNLTAEPMDQDEVAGNVSLAVDDVPTIAPESELSSDDQPAEKSLSSLEAPQSRSIAVSNPPAELQRRLSTASSSSSSSASTSSVSSLDTEEAELAKYLSSPESTGKGAHDITNDDGFQLPGLKSLSALKAADVMVDSSRDADSDDSDWASASGADNDSISGEEETAEPVPVSNQEAAVDSGVIEPSSPVSDANAEQQPISNGNSIVKVIPDSQDSGLTERAGPNPVDLDKASLHMRPSLRSHSFRSLTDIHQSSQQSLHSPVKVHPPATSNLRDNSASESNYSYSSSSNDSDSSAEEQDNDSNLPPSKRARLDRTTKKKKRQSAAVRALLAL